MAKLKHGHQARRNMPKSKPGYQDTQHPAPKEKHHNIYHNTTYLMTPGQTPTDFLAGESYSVVVIKAENDWNINMVSTAWYERVTIDATEGIELPAPCRLRKNASHE